MSNSCRRYKAHVLHPEPEQTLQCLEPATDAPNPRRAPTRSSPTHVTMYPYSDVEELGTL